MRRGYMRALAPGGFALSGFAFSCFEFGGFVLSGFTLGGFACVCMRRSAAQVLAEVRRGRDLVARHIHMTHTRDTNTTSISVLTHDHQNGMANATGGLVSRM